MSFILHSAFLISAIFVNFSAGSSDLLDKTAVKNAQNDMGDMAFGLMKIFNKNGEGEGGQLEGIPFLSIPFLSVAINNLALKEIPKWMRIPKFPYRIVLRMEILALRDQGTSKNWPNLIMGFDWSLKKEVPSRINLKVFHLLSQGFELGIYHKWFRPNFEYGCSTEYLFNGEMVHEAMAPFILENGRQQLEAIHEEIRRAVILNLQKETLDQFCDGIQQKGEQSEKEQKMGNPFLDKIGQTIGKFGGIFTRQPQKCNVVQIAQCRQFNLRPLRVNSLQGQPIRHIQNDDFFNKLGKRP